MFVFYCVVPVSVFAQTIDNTAAYRQVNGEGYFRFHYENDFFTATDYYYTQGMCFELAAPWLRNNPLTVLLPHLNNSCATVGIAVEHIGFTPSSIRHNEIIYNDRPFAAYIMLKTFAVYADTLHHNRLSATVSTGVIGPAAFGGGMQKAIHKWLHNIEPLGWNHQIKNDVVLNYELSYEHQLYNNKNRLLVSTLTKAQAGTLMDNVQAGFTVMAGRFISPFEPCATAKKNNFSFHIYAQPLVSAVAYNATMQGGLFNHGSPYTLTQSQLTRIVFQTNFGLVLHYRKLSLEYCQSFLTKEFNTGTYHRWGGIKAGVGF